MNLYSASDLDKSPSSLSGHMKNVCALSFLEGNQKMILSGSYDGLIVKWVLGVGCSGKLQMKDGAKIKCLAANEQQIISSGFDNKVSRIHLNEDDSKAAENVDVGSQPKDLSLAANIPELTLVSTECGVILLNSLKVACNVNLGFTVTASAIASDGKEAIVGGQDGKLHIFSISGNTLTEEAVLEKHRGPISVIRYSPDASMFASADGNREAVVWDRASRQVKLNNMLFHTARINCLAWSPDSSMVATGSVDTCVIIYEIAKPASSRITIRNAHLGGVHGLVFTDDSTVVSSGEDACIRAWKLTPQ